VAVSQTTPGGGARDLDADASGNVVFAGAIVSDTTGEGGLLPAMHGSSTLSFVALTP